MLKNDILKCKFVECEGGVYLLNELLDVERLKRSEVDEFSGEE